MGAGNIIAGDILGVEVAGDAQNNVVAGNQIGWSAGYTSTIDTYGVKLGLSGGISIGGGQNMVGGNVAGAGHHFLGGPRST